MNIKLNTKQKDIINDKLLKLSNSKFRSSFHLRKYMIKYIDKVGFDTIITHAYYFVHERLSPAVVLNDGKQTPMKGHPVFIAQHACGCCCRKCLEKWHGIACDRKLSIYEENYIVCLLAEWIIREYYKIKEN